MLHNVDLTWESAYFVHNMFSCTCMSTLLDVQVNDVQCSSLAVCTLCPLHVVLHHKPSLVWSRALASAAVVMMCTGGCRLHFICMHYCIYLCVHTYIHNAWLHLVYNWMHPSPTIRLVTFQLGCVLQLRDYFTCTCWSNPKYALRRFLVAAQLYALHVTLHL